MLVTVKFVRLGRSACLPDDLDRYIWGHSCVHNKLLCGLDQWQLVFLHKYSRYVHICSWEMSSREMSIVPCEAYATVLCGIKQRLRGRSRLK